MGIKAIRMKGGNRLPFPSKLRAMRYASRITPIATDSFVISYAALKSRLSKVGEKITFNVMAPIMTAQAIVLTLKNFMLLYILYGF